MKRIGIHVQTEQGFFVHGVRMKLNFYWGDPVTNLPKEDFVELHLVDLEVIYVIRYSVSISRERIFCIFKGFLSKDDTTCL